MNLFTFRLMIVKLSNMINLCELSYILINDIQAVKHNLYELIYIQVNDIQAVKHDQPL